jgi:hypothetical protein
MKAWDRVPSDNLSYEGLRDSIIRRGSVYDTLVPWLPRSIITMSTKFCINSLYSRFATDMD